jgi:integrase
MSAKTVSDKYIAAVNAVLNWAFIEELLPSNEAEKVRQELPKKVQAREKGYTTVEAIKVLKASIGYKSVETDHPSHKESSQITSAKMWVPLLCLFISARAAEMMQLRKEDVRQEGNCLILRITPDVGSVKNGHYRDVPLHR